MGRPIKDNADYFTHDADMRDDPKIKALRRKFKVSGYGVWCMLLEAITDSDNFRLEYDIDIIAGDFDVDPEFLDEVVKYCIKLSLLHTENDGLHIFSKTLDNRFVALLSKRKRDRNELSTSKTNNKKVIDSESAQSRVEYSKVEKSKEDIVYDFSSNPSGLFVIVKDGTRVAIKIHQQSFDKWLDGTFGAAYEGQRISLRSKPPIAEFFKKHNGNIFNDNQHVWSSLKKIWISEVNTTHKPNPGKL